MNYKKYWIPAAVFILLSVGMVLVLNLPPRAREAAGSSAGTAASAPEASASAAVRHPADASASLFLGGEEIYCIQAQDEASMIIIEDAIFDGMSKSMVYQGIASGVLDDKIRLSVLYTGDSKYRDYVVYYKDGRHLIQAEDSTQASPLSGKAYTLLHEFAMGYRLPGALTVVSGSHTIHAFGGAVSSARKSDGLCADMRRYSPQQLAEHIEYLEIEKSGPVPFTPYRNGAKVFGRYSLYDKDFNEVRFIEPSGLAPQTYMFQDTPPGKYIVKLATSFEDDELTYGMEYFFGVIIQ